MSKSVRKDGTVCGPAPLQDSASVICLSERQHCSKGGSTPSVPDSTEQSLNASRSLAVARAALSNAKKSEKHFEARLDKICSGLLVAGEQIPTIDQIELSMLQEAYINAANACRAASEKALIWHNRVERLVAQSTTADRQDDWPMVA